jgi:hypothetical protein
MRSIHRLRTSACLVLALAGVGGARAEPAYPPLLPAGEAYAPPSAEQKLWALATCAVLTESNHRRHDLLGIGMTVAQAVSTAGGYKDFATGIRVFRGTKEVLSKDGLEWRDHAKAWDIQLQDKDAVFVRPTF